MLLLPLQRRRTSCCVYIVFTVFIGGQALLSQHQKRQHHNKYNSVGRPPHVLLARSRYFDSERNKEYWQEDNDSLSEEDYDIYNTPIGAEDASYAEDVVEWERCQTDAGVAHVLLPPPTVDRPTAVLHFVGGTFFGSAPALWYRRLLEDIVKNTQAAVVATSIPVTVMQSPLQHVNLAKKVQRQFQIAWRDILVDEYGQDIQSVPVCRMGHSLGARLLVVLATLQQQQDSTRKAQRALQPPSSASYILISFTNYGASAGIPGVYQIKKVGLRIEMEKRAKEQEAMLAGTRQSRKKRGIRRDMYDEDEFDDEDDEEWGEIFQEFQDIIREQAARVQSALTPATKELEFYPTPEQLWKAVAEDGRYKIPKTLVVQFDDDEVDQSSKLANAIKNVTDIRFARLRGTHLTPVSSKGAERTDDKIWLQQLNSGFGKLMSKIVSGRLDSQASEEALVNLRRSISRYIIDVATKK